MFFQTKKATTKSEPIKWITLTTDFGLSDWYVGVMKGVIAWAAPKTRTIDLTHNIPQGAIQNAAFQLWNSFSYFPEGTVHLAVVDPGVGSSRIPLVLKSRRYFWVGPDNGLLSWAAEQDGNVEAYQIADPKWTLPKKSSTFHGRDIFAPAAAGLSAEWPIEEVGPRIENYIRLDWPKPEVNGNEIQGSVLYADRFGNITTNIESETAHEWIGEGPEARTPFELKLASGIASSIPFGSHYANVQHGEPIALIGSGGFLEIAIRGGSFFSEHGVQENSKFTISRQVRQV